MATRVMLNWATPLPGETEAVSYVGRYDASSGAKWGYVLPVEFVSADTTERRLRFTCRAIEGAQGTQENTVRWMDQGDDAVRPAK